MLYVLEVEAFSVQGGTWAHSKEVFVARSRKEVKEQLQHLVGVLTASAGTDLCKRGEGQARLYLSVVPIWDESQLRNGFKAGVETTLAQLDLAGPESRVADQLIEEAFKEVERGEAEKN
jgi:hypothetical protein